MRVVGDGATHEKFGVAMAANSFTLLLTSLSAAASLSSLCSVRVMKRARCDGACARAAGNVSTVGARVLCTPASSPGRGLSGLAGDRKPPGPGRVVGGVPASGASGDARSATSDLCRGGAPPAPPSDPATSWLCPLTESWLGKDRGRDRQRKPLAADGDPEVSVAGPAAPGGMECLRTVPGAGTTGQHGGTTLLSTMRDAAPAVCHGAAGEEGGGVPRTYRQAQAQGP